MTAGYDPATAAALDLLGQEEAQPGPPADFGARDPARLLARAQVFATIGIANQLAALTGSLQDAIAEGVGQGLDAGLTDLEQAVDGVAEVIDCAPRRRGLLWRRSL